MGLLMALLGSSWLLLGRFGPKMAPKMGPQMAPNRPKMGHLGAQEAQAQPARALLEALASKMAPRWLKMASSSPRQPLGSLLGSSEAVLEGLGPPKTFKNQWFDVRFAFPWTPLCFSIAFVLPSLFLYACILNQSTRNCRQQGT